MAKVTIIGKAVRKVAKDHKSATSIHKPKSKPGPGKAYIKSATTKQDKAYNTFQM